MRANAADYVAVGAPGSWLLSSGIRDPVVAGTAGTAARTGAAAL
jgi:hypothetical protein